MEEYEKKADVPYKSYLVLQNNIYHKIYEYKKSPLTFEHYPLEWFEKKEFFDIDENIFGNALSSLFSVKLGKDVYFQQLRAVCEARPRPVVLRSESSRNLSVISPIQYGSEYSHYTSPYPFRKENYFDSLFKHYPVEIKENDFLVYFGCNESTKIKLGNFQDGKFIPNNFNPIQDYGYIEEVKFNNPTYDFVSEFINAIIKYKLDNRKPEITQEDMDNILEEFGVDSYLKANQFLEALGYNKWVVVNKKRRYSKYLNYNLCIDEVERLGYFIEIELLVEENDTKDYIDNLMGVATDLGLDKKDIVNSHYDTMISKLDK